MLSFLLVLLLASFPAGLSAAPSFRIIPEHVFTMDVVLICQPTHERLNLSAVISVWEYDPITKNDYLGKVVVSNDKHFRFLFRHEEFGIVSPFMIIYHDCGPKVVQDQCYAKTEFHFAEPSELGSTVYLQIDLLREPSNIICDKYPFKRPPPLSTIRKTEDQEQANRTSTQSTKLFSSQNPQ